MQFILPFGPWRREDAEQCLRLGPRQVRLCFVANRRARRYVLRARHDGSVRVTVPRGGSFTEARKFAERNADWLEKQLLDRALNPSRRTVWVAGTEILFRGNPARLIAETHGARGLVRFATEVVRVKDPATDLRPEVERHLWKLAAQKLPARVRELANLHGTPVARVAVRNQRSRWGSCSRRGTISLNWRLIQAPDEVRDYIVLHELAHFKQMNHSRQFWREVEQLCPSYAAAEAWLKSHTNLLQ